MHTGHLVGAFAVTVVFKKSVGSVLISEHHISLVIRQSVFLPKQSQKSMPDKMDLDFWDCLGRVKIVLQQNFIGMI